jgi:hypothetical protein
MLKTVKKDGFTEAEMTAFFGLTPIDAKGKLNYKVK